MTRPARVPVGAVCECFRRPPLRIHVATARALQRQLKAMPLDLLQSVFLDYWCFRCKAIVTITIADVLVADT